MPLIQIATGAPWPRVNNYIAALEAAGATVRADYCPKPDLSCDALLLCGGADINPGHYGEEINGSVDIIDERDEAEFALLKAFAGVQKPVLGICRGSQLINVGLGGSLIQHLPSSSLHTSNGGPDLVHGVTSLEKSAIGRLFGTAFAVNSSHHQAAGRMGEGLVPTAWAEEGSVIEAFEHEQLPIIGIQWHPERMCLAHLREDTPDMLPLFRYFVSLCK